MEFIKIEQLELILLIGAIVAIVARRFRVPYTVGLVVAGIVITFLPLGIEAPFNKDLLFKLLLPPLIFEAALYIDWRELKRDLVPAQRCRFMLRRRYLISTVSISTAASVAFWLRLSLACCPRY